MTGELSLFRFHHERHRDARLVPGIDLAEFARVNHVKLGLHEIGEAAADYPLVFLKDAGSGQFRLAALFGLATGTNSYLHGDFWQAVYLPQEIVAAPFCIAGTDRALCINEASVRVTTDTGDALFSADGSEAPAVRHVRKILDELEQGRAEADQLIAALLALGLIRPLAMTMRFDGGPAEVLQGLYTVSPTQLRAIGPAALADLHSRDFLGPAYAILQSLTQFNRIRQLHNLRSDRKLGAVEMVMEQQ